ncbi:sodium/proline symporter [Candidatus Eisenbacteria bacterium]|uniref:Sodium/proline symporter n=1 Tax=Eiseniibacteriota bacterium TaxID=2212470 RepID=A0ABV6YN69_UNCEI
MGRLTYIIVLAVYLAILALVGVITSRRLKNTSDFAIGGRSIGPWVTALSFVAAYFSSVLIIGGGGFGYKFGMATLWIGASNVLIGCTLAWIILGKRIRRLTEETNSMTISEFLGKRYKSPAVMIFSAAIIFLFLILYNVSIVKGMANAIQVLMDIPYVAGVLISGVVIIFYVAVGGYFAVVWTSFIQAWIMIAGLLLLTSVSLVKIGGLSAAVEKLNAIDPGYVNTPGTWGWAGLISFCLVVSLATWGMPQLVIRFYSIKDTKVLRIGTVVVTVGAAVALLPYLNGAIARIVHPDLASPDLAIPTLTKSMLPPIGGAIFLAGVIAAGMSTFAGVLIITSTSLVRDVYKGALGREISPRKELRLARTASAIVGAISIAIALRPPGLVLAITAFSWAVIASTNLWPMLFGIYWKRTSPAATFASMVIGAGTALVWLLLKNPFGIHGFIAGVAAALIVILLGTLLRPAKSTPVAASTDSTR